MRAITAIAVVVALVLVYAALTSQVNVKASTSSPKPKKSLEHGFVFEDDYCRSPQVPTCPPLPRTESSMTAEEWDILRERAVTPYHPLGMSRSDYKFRRLPKRDMTEWSMWHGTGEVNWARHFASPNDPTGMARIPVPVYDQRDPGIADLVQQLQLGV